MCVKMLHAAQKAGARNPRESLGQQAKGERSRGVKNSPSSPSSIYPSFTGEKKDKLQMCMY